MGIGLAGVCCALSAMVARVYMKVRSAIWCGSGGAAGGLGQARCQNRAKWVLLGDALRVESRYFPLL